MERGPSPRSWRASLIFFAVALSSCSLDYGAGPEGRGAAELPSARFTAYTHTLVVRGAKNFEIYAAEAEAYAESSRTVLTDVRFAEYDPDTGELVSSGRADRAVFFPESEDAEFVGNVRLESKRQDAVLEGESLRWDGEAKRLEGGLDRTVTVRRGDGSWVSGAGFAADARTRSFVFRESVEGLIVRSDEAAE
jgi:LPS export ABC transporter protein LptC